MAETDHSAFEADFSDYYERTLPAGRAAALEAHLRGCERCRGEYDRFREALGALSGLHKMAAPQDFERDVAQTIHRRSAGRFFGRRAFGDRVPFEAIAVFALALVVVLYVLMKWSVTGSLHEPLESAPPAPEIAPGAKEAMPRP